uniref:hypothetical protein n=7 Tax=Thiolapillus sp. TaxID=2017437 RepID=UPI002738D58E
ESIPGKFGGAAASAIIGGTASTLSGGKFANGALSGAFGYLYNQMGEYLTAEGYNQKYGGKCETAECVVGFPPELDVRTIEDIDQGLDALTDGLSAILSGGGWIGGVRSATKKGVIHVTKDGVALPPGAKYKIPDNYVQNPHRSGNYGEIVNGKFKERLRIDPPTPLGQKGPNYSHYHKNGKGTHYSPRPGDKDPGF